ncbi:MAG: endopeptidase La [Candidatus Cloacimonetes bacterium]|nr:endopeptidase La [Candidatus Cloacimonadota bacterium]
MIEKKNKKKEIKNNLPVIPLRNTIVFPQTVTPLLVGRSGSISAAEKALLQSKRIICVPQKTVIDSELDPKAANLFRVGTRCTILQVLRLPDGNLRLLVEGDYRVKITRFSRTRDYLNASYTYDSKEIHAEPLETEALLRSFRKTFSDYIKLNKSIPDEALVPINETHSPRDFFYFVLANTQIDVLAKQELFEINDLTMSIKRLFSIIKREIEIMKLEKKIDVDVKEKLNKIQKEYYLNEQLKVIHRELGISREEKADLIDFQEKLKNTTLPEEVAQKAEEEIQKLSRLSTMSPEYSVVHNYLTWLFDLPWETPVMHDFELPEARQILDADHYGLQKVKERILEYLAVMKLASTVKGQILCFVGPPGVGKTSLGKSIAKALSRKFVRLSLGGVRDEAEIRGHRRTYIGAMPGVIIQSLKKAGTSNPLIMLDEIDKLSTDFHGDPASALLEVLDPEQNNSFRDHYLDFSYDLSKVLFITTANTLTTIPQPLRDRMEIIELPGYTSFEKLNIASRHLIPKVLLEHEVNDKIAITFLKDSIQDIIDKYTREAGVRNLERQIAQVVRKIIRAYLEGEVKNSISIKAKNLERYLGIPKHLYSEVNRQDAIGVVTGLAWTAYGGETLQVEVVKMKGSGKLKLTGQLGDVMQESAQAAYSYARLQADKYGIEGEFYKNLDIHLHIPEGAIPKDGPSAGVTMATAIISVLSGKPVRHDIAMTGEITLTGLVLPIGGLSEKLIAAKRSGIKNVIIPSKNEPNLKEIPEEIKKGMNVILVDKIDQVLNEVLL